ncbi:hypothetical protein BKP45_08680 [Anaerobacillus alkalidiazotrophicus]|uniref:Uncharacterized protein n=1 Tax=Anaerobacillus alkalidiazotrophicus TaxID=472963 RepID=A0A1S2M7L0_9BACI|nr:hypothetical protein [Anaerobacillus alkalidiazotrophicus]OIJ20708.1 hypothetical protein BKP45_08680 [Anaerobacillus alkalidiazotrophicus]
MEELFYSWFKENKEELRKKGIETDLISGPTLTDNPSIFADHLSVTKMGRVTVWNSGAIDIEIVDQLTGQTVLNKHLEIREKTPCVKSILEEYFDCLGG